MKTLFLSLFSFVNFSVFAQQDVYDVARKGTVAEMKQIIEKDASLLNKTNADGSSLLVLAVYRGNREVAKYLIEKGATINYKNPGNTPLMAAAYKGEFEIAEILLKKGADVNTQDAQGYTAFVYGMMNGNLKLIQKLLDYKPNLQLKLNNNQTILELAKSMNNPEINKLLKL